MRWLGAALIIASAVSAPHAMQAAQCNDVGTWTATCTTSGSGSQVDIGASRQNQGPPPAGGSSSTAPSGPGAATPDDGGDEPEECGRLGCRGNYTVAMPPELTIDDLASFRPTTPTLSGEPDGFAVVGMPANIVATASEQVLSGTVLDWDVRVRFTPVAFEFTYGDGTSMVATTGGTSWGRLGQPQFTPTATSHTYRERGTFRAAVTVRYEAAVEFGSGRWRPIPGHISAAAGGYQVRVVEALTALVERTCTERPDGPGC